MSDHDLSHPAARSVHAVTNATQIAISLGAFAAYDVATIDGTREVSARLVELLTPVPQDIAALERLLARQEADLAGLREEGVRMAQYIVELERANSALHVQFAAEQLEREALAAAIGHSLGEHAEFFRRANTLRGKGTPRALAIVHHTPRPAAGATS